MAAELIGRARCPLCHNAGARLSLSKKSLPVLTCTHVDCGIQLFARGEEADFKLRELLAPAAEPTPAPERTEAPAPAPVRTAATPNPPPPAALVQAPPPSLSPAPAPALRWGFGAF